jgi:hypothetical protein
VRAYTLALAGGASGQFSAAEVSRISGIVRRSVLILKSRSSKAWCRNSAMPRRGRSNDGGKSLALAEDISRGTLLATRVRLPLFLTADFDTRIRMPLLVRGRTARSDVGVANTVRTRTVKLAADRVGGRRKLRDLLGVSSAALAAWITGVQQPSEEAFLRALELILDELDATEGDDGRR